MEVREEEDEAVDGEDPEARFYDEAMRKNYADELKETVKVEGGST